MLHRVLSEVIAASPSDPTTTDGILEWLRTGGAIGVLATAVVAFVRGWIVSGTTHRQVIAERDRALELVYAQAEIAERALAALEIQRGKRQ